MSPRAPKRATVAAEAWRAIFDLILATSPERTQALGRLGLTPNDARALYALAAEPGRTMSSLAEAWQCDASTATWIVDRLEARGFAERQAHPTDRRVRLVVLTPAGAQTKAELAASTYQPPKEMLEMDLADLVALRDAASKIRIASPTASQDRARPRRRADS